MLVSFDDIQDKIAEGLRGAGGQDDKSMSTPILSTLQILHPFSGSAPRALNPPAPSWRPRGPCILILQPNGSVGDFDLRAWKESRVKAQQQVYIPNTQLWNPQF